MFYATPQAVGELPAVAEIEDEAGIARCLPTEGGRGHAGLLQISFDAAQCGHDLTRSPIRSGE